MLINGDAMDEVKTLAALWEAKSDDACRELELRGVELDYELTCLLIEVIRAKKWQRIRLEFCQGLVNDVVTACMSHDVCSFFIQSAVDGNIMNSLGYGLNYSKSLLSLRLTIDINSNQSGNFTKAVARNVCLEDLDLSGSTIDPQCIGNLGFALRINRTLKSLSLDGCYIEDSHLASLLMALQDHPVLKSLSLQQNSCHDQSMPAISALLHYNYLEELNMSFLVRKKKAATPTVEPKAEVEPEPEKEETEDVSEQKEEVVEESAQQSEDDKSKTDEPEPEDKEIEKEPEPEPEPEKSVHNNTLKNLQLAGNGLRDEFVESMLRIFGENSALEELNLFGNRMTDRGVYGIIQKLPQLKNLRCLSLGHNAFSTMCARALVEAMRNNYVLEELNIRSLGIDIELDKIQSELDYYARLNRGGRRIFASDVTKMPMSVWPLILERANRIHLGGRTSNALENDSHAADAIFCLLHGPALLDNHDLTQPVYRG